MKGETAMNENGIAMNATMTLTFKLEPGCNIIATKEKLQEILPTAVPNFVSNRIFLRGEHNFVKVRDAIAEIPGIVSVGILPS